MNDLPPSPTVTSTPAPCKRRRWPFVVGGVITVLAGGTAFLWLYDEPFPDDSDLLAPNSVAAADFVPVYPAWLTALKERKGGLFNIPQPQKTPLPEPTSNNIREHLLYFNDLASDPIGVSFSEIKKSSVSSEKEFDTLRNEIDTNGVNEKNIAVAREILETNSKVLDASQKILKNLNLRTPPVQNLNFSSELTEVFALQKFIRITSLQVQVLQFEGKTDEAFLLEKSILDFLHRIPVAGREESLVMVLSQISVLSYNIVKTFPVLVPRLNKEQCNSLTNTLLKIENSYNADAFKMVLRTEYTWARNTFKNRALIKDILKIREFPMLFFKPNRLLRKIGDECRTTLQILNEDTVDETTLFLPDTWEKKVSFLDYLIPAEIEKRGSGPSFRYEGAYNYFLEHRAHLRAVRIALAARAYSLDNAGNLPTELSVLVPKYLPVLPTDPFSKEKALLHYDAKQGLIWSIGRNFKDEAGEGYFTPNADKRNLDRDDIAFKIPGAAAR
jgi:hypothetical protein